MIAYIYLIIKVRGTKVDPVNIFLLAVYFAVMLMKFLRGINVFDYIDDSRYDYLISYIGKTLITLGLTTLIFEM